MLQTASIPEDGLGLSLLFGFSKFPIFFLLLKLQVFVHCSLILIALIQLFLVYSPDI